MHICLGKKDSKKVVCVEDFMPREELMVTDRKRPYQKQKTSKAAKHPLPKKI